MKQTEEGRINVQKDEMYVIVSKVNYVNANDVEVFVWIFCLFTLALSNISQH